LVSMKELVLLSGSPNENGKLSHTFLQQENHSDVVPRNRSTRTSDYHLAPQ
jgi:hypothetical protein